MPPGWEPQDQAQVRLPPTLQPSPPLTTPRPSLHRGH